MKRLLQFIALVFLILFLPNCSFPKRHSLSTGLRHPPNFYGYGFQGYEVPPKNKFIKYKEPKGKILNMELLSAGSPPPEMYESKESLVRSGPPSSVWVGKNLWIDQRERSNLDWHEFLEYIKNDSSRAYYLSLIPDVEVIRLTKNDYYQPPSKELEPYRSYFLNPTYLYYPVVGISYYQAKEYCKWKGKLISEMYGRFENIAREPVVLNYRLPTESEWEKIASRAINTSNYPFGFSQIDIEIELADEFADFAQDKIDREVSKEQLLQDIREYNATNPRDLVVNCKRDLPYFRQFKTPYPVISRIINSAGLYHMIGNVAEMVAEKGIAKGGSWKHPLEESKIKDRIIYSGPNDHVGFRCICEAKKME